MFVTDINDIELCIDAINPIQYARTRNYLDGAVTKLSPYISRGVISTKYILDKIIAKGFSLDKIEKFVQELAWRDYYQQVWTAKEDQINEDIKQQQINVTNNKIAANIINATTGIIAIDKGITDLYATGYMHNHIRMYIASIACNIANSHWKTPAQWLYYYLLDADWASNALSWQWVAGSFSSKKYYANQENINKYCYTSQHNTFLDVSYFDLINVSTPKELYELTDLLLETELPVNSNIEIDKNIPTLIYNFYNLDPYWKKEILANRVLLLEPSFFKKYPVCSKTIEFVIQLSKNIKGVQIYVGEFNDLEKECTNQDIYFKTHPTNKHYKGKNENRDWLVEEVTGYYPSFFAYWKKIEKKLKTYF